MKSILINSIKVPVEEAYHKGLENCVRDNLQHVLKSDNYKYVGLHRKSIDARRKKNIYYNISAEVEVEDSFNVENIINAKEYEIYTPNKLVIGKKKMESNVVIVGAGPCGLFTALLLAQYGYNPIVIERGSDIDIREQKVKDFWKNNILDVNNNVQFGEGGSGTFSDGKLVTRVKDIRARYVIDTFHKFGAKDSIKYEAKPHIGTDQLKTIIKNIRNEIISNGGTFLFDTHMTNLIIKNNKIKAITVNNKENIDCDILVLAIGHSARDTYELLYDRGVSMIQKSFSMGLRIEHLNSDINYAQFGKSYRFINESAEYYLSGKINNRSAYTFCMCPGGVVVNAASEEQAVTTNGMSFSKRDGINSNSAWVVNVNTSDFKDKHPLSGIEFQRNLERKTYIAGGSNYNLPIQTMKDFLNDEKTTSLRRIKPSTTSGYEFSNLNDILPNFIKDTLKGTLKGFDNKLRGFANENAILTGCETRTSSPVRIVRDENLTSINIQGIYPGGEGAGYAGGITSAAIDGLKLAEKIIETYNNK